MEDNQTLLMMVLKQHFRDRPQILDEALRIIKEYSSQDSTSEQYEKTVEILRSKMNDLPLHILLYFLNMIPLPKQDSDFKSRIIEEITANEKIDSIRSKLVEYLNSKIPPLIPIKTEALDKKSHMSYFFNNTVHNSSSKFVRPKKTWRRRNAKSQQKGIKPLVDICAEFVIKNQNYLKQYYKDKKEKVWTMVNSNKYDQNELYLLYGILKDLNKKGKLMRMIDNEETCQEVLVEEYGNSDIFLKEKHLFQAANEDPFVVSDELKDAVINFIGNYRFILHSRLISLRW